jgi:hypothetical protein
VKEQCFILDGRAGERLADIILGLVGSKNLTGK